MVGSVALLCSLSCHDDLSIDTSIYLSPYSQYPYITMRVYTILSICDARLFFPHIDLSLIVTTISISLDTYIIINRQIPFHVCLLVSLINEQ